jgi:phosphoglycolate phosphatase
MAGVTVVFDLDGTLVDTAPDLVETLNVVFTREGLPSVPFERARSLIGGGARVMIERGLLAEGRSCAPAEIDRLFRQFTQYYSAHIADRSRPFPALEAALDSLAADGAQFAVCTNKLESLSVKLLDALDLSRHFVAICGQDTFGVQKPDPQILLKTIGQAGGDPERAVMVGDSANDINAARAAGIPIVAVDFGYTEVPVTELNPDRVISGFDALPVAVRGLMGAALRTAERLQGGTTVETRSTNVPGLL